MLITIILIALLGILSAFEEVQQLVQRGSWRREDYRYPEWHTDWRTWKATLDSHHVAFGLFIVVMILALYFAPITEWYMMIVAFVLFWWIRNIFMHIVFKKKPLWVYLWKI